MRTILYIDDNTHSENTTKVVIENGCVEQERYTAVSYYSDKNKKITIKTNNPHILAHELEAVAQQLRRMGE